MSPLVLALAIHAAATSAAPPPSAPATSDFGAAIDRLATRTAGLPRDRWGLAVLPLRALGRPALPALLGRLARESSAMAAVRAKNPEAARAFVEDLVEAVGQLRDRRALDALAAIFNGGAGDARLLRSAADGLGRLCDEGGFEPLALHANAGDSLAPAAFSGLGLCREERSATILARALDGASDPAAIESLADALGQLASSWAWQALGPARAAEGQRVRRLAASALLAAWLRAPPPAREAIAEALVMTDDAAVARALVDDRFAPLRPLWRRAHRP